MHSNYVNQMNQGYNYPRPRGGPPVNHQFNYRASNQFRHRPPVVRQGQVPPLTPPIHYPSNPYASSYNSCPPPGSDPSVAGFHARPRFPVNDNGNGNIQYPGYPTGHLVSYPLPHAYPVMQQPHHPHQPHHHQAYQHQVQPQQAKTLPVPAAAAVPPSQAVATTEYDPRALFLQQLNKSTAKSGTAVAVTVATTPAANPAVPATTASALSQYMSMVNGEAGSGDPNTTSTTASVESIPVPPPDPQMTALQAAAMAYSQHQQMIAAATAQQESQPTNQSSSQANTTATGSTTAQQQEQYAAYYEQYQSYYQNYMQHMQQQGQQQQHSLTGSAVRYPVPIQQSDQRQFQYGNGRGYGGNGYMQRPRPGLGFSRQQFQGQGPPLVRMPQPAAASIRIPPPLPLIPLPAKPAISSEDINMLIKLNGQHEQFETMYKNWEDQFEMWKKNNAAHPQAGEITKEWTDWQEKLLKRRSEIQSLIVQCVNKIERPKENEVSGVEQLLTQPSIAHLLREQRTQNPEEKNKNGKSDADEPDDDCQVIEVMEKEAKEPEVITIASEDAGKPPESEATGEEPGQRRTTITVIPDKPAAASTATCAKCNKAGHEASKCPSSASSSHTAKTTGGDARKSPRYELSDDEYGDEEPRVTKEVVATVEEESEEQIAKRKAEEKANQDKFFNLCIGKMHEIISKNAPVTAAGGNSSKNGSTIQSNFYHNYFQPAKKSAPRTPGKSSAYRIDLVRKSRLNEDTPLRNRSPPPDYVPPPSARPNVRPPPKPCPRCKEFGHTPTRCSEMSQRRCWRCSQVGHWARACPNAEQEREVVESSNPVPMERRRRKVYSESHDLFPEAPKKVVPEGEQPPTPNYGFLNPQSKFVIQNFEDEFYRLPSEPEFTIVQDPIAPYRDPDAEAAHEAELETERRIKERQQQELEAYERERRREQDERDRQQQEIDRQQKEIEMMRRRELDPNRIGDQFLEKLRTRNRVLDREEQERLDREQEYQNLLSHPNRYTIERAVRELERPIVILLRGLIGSGKSRAAKCIKEEATALDDELMCRILSIDDYFMEPVEMVVIEDGKGVIRKKIVYQYDGKREDEYRDMLCKKLDATLWEGKHELVIVDACNNQERELSNLLDCCEQRRATVVICEMEEWDEAVCFHNGTHHRTLDEIHRMKRDWYDTPSDMTALVWSFRTTKAVEMLMTQQDLQLKPVHPSLNSLKRVLHKVQENNKRLRNSHPL